MRTAFLVPVLTLGAVLPVSGGGVHQGGKPFRAGNRLFDKGRFADAVNMYTLDLERDPGDAMAYYNRALSNEMVDRRAAIRDWARFVQLTRNDPAWRERAPRLQDRLEALRQMPALPGRLQPSQYVPRAEDYYKDVAVASTGLQFSRFPVRIFVGSVPKSWQRATRKALDDWSQIVPLEEAASQDGANVVLSWQMAADESERPGWEREWVQVRKKEDSATVERTVIAFITLNSAGRWSEDQKRAIVSHEIGHALSIQGHSHDPKDIMFPLIHESLPKLAERGYEPAPPYFEPSPSIASSSLPAKPSQRDINTLIRLYNSPGPLTRLGP